MLVSPVPLDFCSSLTVKVLKKIVYTRLSPLEFQFPLSFSSIKSKTKAIFLKI